LVPTSETTAPAAPLLDQPAPVPQGKAAASGPVPLSGDDATEVGTIQEPAPAPSRRPIGGWLQLLLSVLLLYLGLFHLSVVRGSSMAPSIHDGDRILIDPFSYMLHAVERGDIVVLKYPLDPSVDYIKRVVGLPGDEVLIQEGEVWVNGLLIDEPYVASPDPFCSLRVTVKPAHYFVLGDNRQRSCDSREFGQVPADYVRGKVELRLWPPARAGLIDG
jgi:signal peptidase I